MLRQWPSLPASLARMIYVRHPQHTATNGGHARRALAAPADGQASRATATTRCLRRVDRRNERAPDVSRLAPPNMTTAPSAPASGCRRAARCPLAPCTSLMMCVDHKESRADNLTRTNCISSSSSSTRRGRTSGRMAAAFEAAPWTVHTLSATDYATVVVRDGCRLLVHRALVRHHATAAAHARQ